MALAKKKASGNCRSLKGIAGSKPKKLAGPVLARKSTAFKTRGKKVAKRPDLDEAVIFLRENLKVPGAQTRERYERYKNASTVSEALAMGATKQDLVNDLRTGTMIKVTDMHRMDLYKCVRLFASEGTEPVTFQYPNPKKPTTKAWNRYQRYQHASTIQECKKAGIWPGDIRNDMARGYLKFGHCNSRSTGPGSRPLLKIRTASKKGKELASKKGRQSFAKKSFKGSKGRSFKQTKQSFKREGQLPWSQKLGWV